MDSIERPRACTGFDWDEGDSGKSWRKHRVTDRECGQVFFHEPLVVAGSDDRHSDSEERLYVLGHTDEGRELFLVCTIGGERIRVICARPMSRRERRILRRHEQ